MCRTWGLVGVLAWALAQTPCLASKLDIKIGPGPSVISEEEKAIQADPANGLQDGVVLVDEGEWTENLGMNSDYTYHFRAKILSNQGRDLANIEMPWNMEESGLYEWWARTILPDGKVLELSKEDFVQQPVMKRGKEERRVLRGALPGVVPGCVIDYGYDYLGRFELTQLTLHLNRDWPVREYRFRWKFPQRTSGDFRVKAPPGLDVQAVEDKKSILVTGHNLPPIVVEPYMPPRHELEARVTLYYKTHADSWWSETGADGERKVEALITPAKQTFIKTLESIPFKDGSGAMEKAEQVYDWMERTFKNEDLLTYEDDQKHAAETAKKTPPSADSLLQAHSADGYNLARLYIGLVRALGMHADIVLAADRRDHLWDRELFVNGQFDEFVVGVRGADDPVEKTAFADPGSGLPFGVLPWWLTGTPVLMTGADNSRIFTLPPVDPKKNISTTTGTIAFAENNAKMAVAWSRAGKGEQGLRERRVIRSMVPAERRKFLENMCGATETSEIQKAESPGFDTLGKSFALECKDSRDTTIDDEVDVFSLGLFGPWFEGLPELTAATRVHPIIFDFPRVDLCTLDVKPPEGFKTIDPPAVVLIESKFGRYRLEITVAGGAYHVDRKFALVPIHVPAEEYQELKRFLTDVRRADKTKLEFHRPAKS